MLGLIIRVAGIERGSIRIAWPAPDRIPRGDQLRDFRAALECGIHQPIPDQALDRDAIHLEMVRLPPHRLLPPDSKPSQVFVNRVLEFGPAAGGVDILDAQQEHAAALPRHVEIQQRGIGVAEMQIAIGAGRKTENGWRHDPDYDGGA